MVFCDEIIPPPNRHLFLENQNKFFIFGNISTLSSTFFVTFNTFCSNMDKLYIKNYQRPFKILSKKCSKIFLIIVICTQKVYSYCHLLLKLLYIVGKSSFWRNFLGICKFYGIFLITVIVVIIETHVRCHWLSMGS